MNLSFINLTVNKCRTQPFACNYISYDNVVSCCFCIKQEGVASIKKMHLAKELID